MSDAKKTGSRDISELKQRLGLKKGAAAASQSGSAQRANGAPSGGVVPPPGLNLPPPPGAQTPQPQLPNAADDPFGAMNAMAAHGAVQRAPEIVIVNDGNPVEQVGARSGAATLLRFAVPAALALIVGIAIGKIGSSASSYNGGIEGAKALLGDTKNDSSVTYLKKALSDLDTELDSKAASGFKPDPQLDADLKKLAQRLAISDKMKPVIHQAEHQLVDGEVLNQLVSFYAGVAQVKDMLDEHEKAAIGDDIMHKGKTPDDPNAPHYAIYVQAPTDTDHVPLGAMIVELTGVYCGTSNTPQPRCADNEAPAAYAYRNDPGESPYSKGDLASGDPIQSKKLLPLLPNGILDAVMKGAVPTASDVYYSRRLKAIYEVVRGKPGPDGKPSGGLLDQGNKLETRLQTVAGQGKRFSFFM